MFQFLSTPSVGRATKTRNPNIFPKKISIHALRGEGDNQTAKWYKSDKISIHALRGEGDP